MHNGKIMNDYLNSSNRAKYFGIEQFIVNQADIWLYCLDKKPEILEIRKKITESYYAMYYCQDIGFDTVVAQHITDSGDAYHYCSFYFDSIEVAQHITDSYMAYRYCKSIKDRPEVSKHITDFIWKRAYDRWKKGE